jgi:hypothetical protein
MVLAVIGAVFVFGGDDGPTRIATGDEPTSSSSTESTTTSSTVEESTTSSSIAEGTDPGTGGPTVATPATESSADVLARTDFANKTYDVECFDETNRITLVNGGGAGGEFGDLRVDLIEAFPDDFDGDGDGEVVVRLGCAIGASGSEVDAMIFEAENGQVIQQGSLLVAFRGNVERDGREFVQTTAVEKPGEASCCPSEFREERFRVASAPFGSFFESVAVQFIPSDAF